MAAPAFAIASEPMLNPAADSPPFAPPERNTVDTASSMSPRSDVIPVCRHPAEARVAPWPIVFRTFAP